MSKDKAPLAELDHFLRGWTHDKINGEDACESAIYYQTVVLFEIRDLLAALLADSRGTL